MSRNCINCTKELTGHGKAIRCRSCSKKGILNPRYTDGTRTMIRNCIDCNKILSKRKNASRCKSCHWKFHNSGINNPMYGMRGNLSPAYIDGRDKLSKLIRGIFESRQWRSDIFTRDNFTCQGCFIKGGKLNAHHIKPFYKIMEDNNIRSLNDAMDCAELWNLNNGITLCLYCHKKTDSYLINIGNNKYAKCHNKL